MKEYICKNCIHEKNCTELKCDGVAGCKFYINKADICAKMMEEINRTIKSYHTELFNEINYIYKKYMVWGNKE